jgi:hypothetical protein
MTESKRYQLSMNRTGPHQVCLTRQAGYGVRTIKIVAVIGIAVLFGTFTPQAEAINWLEKKITLVTLRATSLAALADPTRTDEENAALIKGENKLAKEIRKDYNDMQKGQGLAARGIAMIGGEDVSELEDAEPTILTFMLVNPDTDQQVLVPEVASVQYYVNLDPTIDVNDPNFDILIGESFDVASNFSLPWAITGFEPQITAIPFDTLGQQIMSPGFDGTDIASGIAVNIVPEPGALSLLTLGGMMLARRRRVA